MPSSDSVILWTLIIGTMTLLTLGVIFIATIVINQRRFVTIERQTLETLQEREQRFRSLIENSFDAIALITPDGIITYASESTHRVLGYSTEEFIALPIYERINPNDLANLKTLFDTSARTPGRRTMLQFRARHKDGSWRWLEGVTTNLLSEPTVNAIVLNYRDITERKQAEEHLKSSHDQLRKLSAHLQSVREEERTHIAREIHDELGQMLTVLKMDLVLLERKLNEHTSLKATSDETENIKSMSTLIDNIIQSVRRIATELRPEILDELGLREAIEWELQNFQDRTGIKTKLSSNVKEISLSKDCSTALYRIFQETLTNVARHANATQVKTILQHKDGTLLLEVQDNGRGITERESSGIKSLGLLGIRERALLIGGDLNVHGEEGKGTLVSVRVPLSTFPIET